MNEDFTSDVKAIEKCLRLRTFPIGIKFVKNKDDLKGMKKLKYHEICVCQAIPRGDSRSVHETIQGIKKAPETSGALI
jgi:uncharacterized protein (DUF169 family)